MRDRKDAALRIQKIARGQFGRKRAEEAKEAKEEQARTDAALRVQGAFKAKKAKKEKEEKIKGITGVQAKFRGDRERRILESRRIFWTNEKGEIETKGAIKNFNSILKEGNNFLIDRGDLSKDVNIENIPFVQRKLFLLKNKYKNKKIFVATNLLESMMTNNYPTRGEANDIFNCLEMGSHGLVLAAETAIGKYPKEAVSFLKKMIQVFKKNK